jgi:hypothetical protein
MIHALFALVLIAVGAGAYIVTHPHARLPQLEKIVYCPLGTTDPECVAARRQYDAGTISTPSGTR